MGRHIENTELTPGLTGVLPTSDTSSDSKHPLVKEFDSLANLGKKAILENGYCGITFPSRRRSTRGLRRGRLP